MITPSPRRDDFDLFDDDFFEPDASTQEDLFDQEAQDWIGSASSLPSSARAPKPKKKKDTVWIPFERTIFNLAQQPGVIPASAMTDQLLRDSARHVIQQAGLRARARSRLGSGPDFPPLPSNPAAAMAKLPFRGEALVCSFELDLAQEADAQRCSVEDYLFEVTNGRTTASRSERWICEAFQASRHSNGDRPGSDAYFERGDMVELISVKSLARTGFSPLISALTTHGTRSNCDQKALLDSIELSAWFGVADTTSIPHIRLFLIPSRAVSDWAQAGFLSAGGLKTDRLIELLSASCQLRQVAMPVIDNSALSASNKLAAEARLAALRAEADAKQALIDQACQSRSKPLFPSL